MTPADTRALPLATRETISDLEYVDASSYSVRILVAAPQDHDAIRSYIYSHHKAHNAGDVALVDSRCRHTIIATHHFKLCGVITARLEASHTRASLRIDFAGVNEELQSSQLANRLMLEMSKWARAQRASHLHCALDLMPAPLASDMLPAVYKLPSVERTLIYRNNKDPKRVTSAYVATEADRPVIYEYLRREQTPQDPWSTTLQLTESENDELAQRQSQNLRFNGLTYLLVNANNYICGIFINKIVDVNRDERGDLSKRDFTREIDAYQAGGHHARSFVVLENYCASLYAHFLPHDCEKIFVFEYGSVFPYYTGLGLIEQQQSDNYRSAQNFGLRYLTVLPVSPATLKVLKRMGVNIVHEIPFDEFLYRGKPIFPGGKLANGLDKLYIGVADLKSVMPKP